MIINHNISAMNANRMFANNVSKMEKNTTALASGLRINQGSDDAAGLAVSEKMRGQIRGLNQASRNIQDSISLVQTTEGFLKETNDVLHRMRELSVQAANGTYTKEDRAQITVELDEMVKEVNRIHEDAKFNTIRLLDGYGLRNNSFATIDANGDYADGKFNGAAFDSGKLVSRNANFNATTYDNGTKSLIPHSDNPELFVPNNGLVVQSGANTDERMFAKFDAFNTYALGLTQQPDAGNQPYAANTNLAWREKSFYNEKAVDINADMYLESEISAAPLGEGIPGTTGATTGNPGVTIHNLFAVIDSADAANTVNRVNVNTSERATETITVLDVALNKVNKQRADLGAFQNRLEKASEGVDNAAENLQAAESRIRDTDMAKEFVEFTKNQILSQSAASMTGQANMRSQLVMRILG
jgi:flagellin